MVPCIKGADALDFAGFHAYYEELITKTRENKPTADDFQGTNISLTNPGGIGTIASVPRLMSGQGTIIACGSLAYPVEWAHAPADKVKALREQGDDDDLDLRPPRHPGAESGSFLRRIEELLQGEDEFYESVARDLGVDEAVVTKAHAAAASAAPLPSAAQAAPAAGASPTPSCCGGPGRHLAAEGISDPRPPRGEPRPARLRAEGGSRDPAREPEPDTRELMSQIPADILRIGVEGETLLDALPRMRRPTAARWPTRSSTSPAPAADVAAGDDRDRLAPQALEPEEKHALLDRLIDVFGFERYVEKAYLGQKMFSIEGSTPSCPCSTSCSRWPTARAPAMS